MIFGFYLWRSNVTPCLRSQRVRVRGGGGCSTGDAVAAARQAKPRRQLRWIRCGGGGGSSLARSRRWQLKENASWLCRFVRRAPQSSPWYAAQQFLAREGQTADVILAPILLAAFANSVHLFVNSTGPVGWSGLWMNGGFWPVRQFCHAWKHGRRAASRHDGLLCFRGVSMSFQVERSELAALQIHGATSRYFLRPEILVGKMHKNGCI